MGAQLRKVRLAVPMSSESKIRGNLKIADFQVICAEEGHKISNLHSGLSEAQ